jgi:hypothetical protein
MVLILGPSPLGRLILGRKSSSVRFCYSELVPRRSVGLFSKLADLCEDVEASSRHAFPERSVFSSEKRNALDCEFRELTYTTFTFL